MRENEEAIAGQEPPSDNGYASFPKNNLTGRPLITDNIYFGLSGRMW
jgi:hypothetical protein